MSKAIVIFRQMSFRATVLAACFALAGCIAHRSVESTHETIAAEVQPGDRLEIELQNGQKLNLRVIEILDTELVGDTSTDITRGEVVTVPYEDIQQLERIFVDHKKTLIAAGGTAVSIVVLMIVGLLLAGATF
ncbi:MAG: hypothetical protein JSW21_12490 [Gammaproteobacteria bacterium]|nr:MAG: hypothetical protein JSW21_12490 [Gammaproteobacteria bacterium]